MAVDSTAGHLLNGDNAAFQLTAADVLKLHGGVADVIVIAQDVIELDQDTRALRRGDVCDGDVAGKRARTGTEAPDMQVVNVDYTFDGFHAGADFCERNAARCAFEQNIECLAHDPDAGPEDERGNDEGENRVDPVLTCEQNS